MLYLLDGTPAFLLEMTAVTTRLRNDGNAPEMIIVAIENTNRDRDMMPVAAKDFPVPLARKHSLASLRGNSSLTSRRRIARRSQDFCRASH